METTHPVKIGILYDAEIDRTEFGKGHREQIPDRGRLAGIRPLNGVDAHPESTEAARSQCAGRIAASRLARMEGRLIPPNVPASVFLLPSAHGFRTPLSSPVTRREAPPASEQDAVMRSPGPLPGLGGEHAPGPGRSGDLVGVAEFAADDDLHRRSVPIGRSARSATRIPPGSRSGCRRRRSAGPIPRISRDPLAPRVAITSGQALRPGSPSGHRSSSRETS